MARLIAGQAAPAFETRDHFGEKVSLSGLLGRKVLLSFYRYASCPLCNMRVNQMIRRHAAWQAAGLEMIGVFQSPARDIRRYVGRQDAPFPIVPDATMQFYRRYGVETSWLGMIKGSGRLGLIGTAMAKGFVPGRTNGPIHRVPADFLIDETGRLALCFYGRDAGDHLDFATIDRFAGIPGQDLALA
jgi:thioredoxin-dependent peroxiredoxin